MRHRGRKNALPALFRFRPFETFSEKATERALRKASWGTARGTQSLVNDPTLPHRVLALYFESGPGSHPWTSADFHQRPQRSTKQPRAWFLSCFSGPLTSQDFRQRPPAAAPFLGYVWGYPKSRAARTPHARYRCKSLAQCAICCVHVASRYPGGIPLKDSNPGRLDCKEQG